MDLPDNFDLDALLAPIPGDVPQGIDVREDYTPTSPYGRLRDARSDARDAEKQAESPDPNGPPPADPSPMWRTLREIGLQLLTETTKDLEIAAWVTEGFVRSHGLAGLTAGSRLIAGLAERYWDGLYPLPDEYGLETRVAPVVGLNGRSGGGSLIAPLFKLTLFNRPDGSPVAYYQYRSSAALVSLDAERRQQRIAAGTIPFDELERDARTVGVRALTRLREEASAALAAWDAMAACLDERAGDESPSTGDVRELLRDIIGIAQRYAPAADAPAVADETAAEPAADDSGGPAGAGGLSVTARQLASREDALRTLETVALFFRRTEPHSPLSYTLDEAVRRARMPWLELLEEVVGDADTRNAILTTLGIRPPPPPE